MPVEIDVVAQQANFDKCFLDSGAALFFRHPRVQTQGLIQNHPHGDTRVHSFCAVLKDHPNVIAGIV